MIGSTRSASQSHVEPNRHVIARRLLCSLFALAVFVAGSAVGAESWEPTVQLNPLKCGAPLPYPQRALDSKTTGQVGLTLELDKSGHVTNHWVRSVPRGDKGAVHALVATTALWAESCVFDATESDDARRTKFDYVWKLE